MEAAPWEKWAYWAEVPLKGRVVFQYVDDFC